MPKKSLAETNPELAKQWHPTLNDDLTPNDFTPGSGKKVWWKCNEGDDHEWETSPKHRKNGTNCPICSNKKIVPSNCLATTHPALAAEWHPTKNEKYTPFNLGAGSNKKVWWKCEKGYDHEWSETIIARVQGNGCTICSNRKVVSSNCLLTTHPKIAKQWHPTKNGDFTPQIVVIGSTKKIWWKCDKGDDHEWQAVLYSRINSGCPICTGRKVVLANSLQTKNPKLLKEWDFKKNIGIKPDKIYYSSTRKVWWKCDKGDDHEWQATIQTRNNGVGCPYCSGQKVSSTNSFSNIYPNLARMWHPTKNDKLSPKNFTSKSSRRKVWWKCDKGDDHEWQARISNISNGNNCPFCANRKISKTNSLINCNPSLASEWHKEKNVGVNLNQVIYGGKKIYWWKCAKGKDHIWRASLENRKKGKGCPYCTLTPQSKQELTITFELLKLFKNIDPKGLKTKLNGKLRALDIFIPTLNLCIEFDGAYWHKEQEEIDKIKSEMLFDKGFKVIRVREEPLPKTHDNDVISKIPYNGKQVTNDVLSMIMCIFELDARLVSKIKEYQSKKGLQNEKGLEKYIDKILTEKAEKNGNI